MALKHQHPQWYRLLQTLRAGRDILRRPMVTHEINAALKCNSSSMHRALNQLEHLHGYLKEDKAKMIKRGRCEETGECTYFLESEPEGGPINTSIRDILHGEVMV